MNLFHAAILGFVEGLTEFLPISSTGHLIIAAKLLGLSQTEFLKSFEIAIQLGAILAVVALYGRRLLISREIFVKVCVAFMPTAILGAIFYKVIKKYLLSGETLVLWTLLLGGIIIILFEKWHKTPESGSQDWDTLTYKKAFWVGVCQSVAMVPGVSRAGATIIGGLVMGIPRRVIVEFSFLLAVPTMLAATVLDLIKSGFTFGPGEAAFLTVGFVTSFIVAILVIKVFLQFIRNHTFTVFGWYRIFAAILLFFVLQR